MSRGGTSTNWLKERASVEPTRGSAWDEEEGKEEEMVAYGESSGRKS